MAIYHLEAKIVSRGMGRSAVAATAYMSCSRMLNNYDGVQHDYTRKHGLVWQQVFLPPMAPAEWQDREKLWNAVETTETAKDNRLAREFVVALPVELNRKDQIALLEEFIKANFVADGMCADAAIHDTDGHNPHAHILLTVRPLNEDGTWQYKTEKEYLCVRNGEESEFTAAEYKAAQSDGWEKQYQYRAGKKKEYLAPSEAEIHGYERISKYPKSTKFGRQNPISERWNSDEQLLAWREAWADVANKYLALYPWVDERIDHRSHAARGIDEQPTIHEGVISRALEQKGVVSDRCELNRQIRADNKLLREMQNTFHALIKAVKNTIPAIAEALETARKKLFIFRYQIRHIQIGKDNLSRTLHYILPDFQKYTGVVKKLNDRIRQRKDLLAEKKITPVLRVGRHMDLSRQIAALTEELEELKSEKRLLLLSFDKADDDGMKAVRQRVGNMEALLKKLEQSESRYAAELEEALKQYKELTKQAAGVDVEALAAQRQAIRPDIMKEGVERIRTAYGDLFDYDIMRWAKSDVEKLLGEEPERSPSVRECLKQAQRQTPPTKKHRDDMER